MSPGRLEQLDKKAPMVLIAGAASCSLRVFLPTDAPKPLLDVFGPHPGGPCCMTIRQLGDNSSYLYVQWSIVVDFNPVDVDWERVTLWQPPCIQIDSL